MEVAYFDCFSGISGDMTLGALLDLGMEIKDFKNEVKKLQLTGYTIEVKHITRHNIAATDVYIKIQDSQPHRSYQDIKQIITSSKLSEKIKTTSIKIFEQLARAESKIHNIDFKDVHFHEVGAIDSIIDIIGTVILLEYYNISKIISSPLPLGTGFVDCAHGKLPIPAPATLELVKHFPVYQTNRKQELVTPTGAALITTLAETFGPMPAMNITKIGYGAGKTPSTHPNLLRICIGKPIQTKHPNPR
jgi:uncharacterized protein (TIGR00299 family) protein